MKASKLLGKMLTVGLGPEIHETVLCSVGKWQYSKNVNSQRTWELAEKVFSDLSWQALSNKINKVVLVYNSNYKISMIPLWYKQIIEYIENKQIYREKFPKIRVPTFSSMRSITPYPLSVGHTEWLLSRENTEKRFKKYFYSAKTWKNTTLASWQRLMSIVISIYRGCDVNGNLLFWLSSVKPITCLIIKILSNGSHLRDILQNTCTILFKTVRVIKESNKVLPPRGS